MLFLLFLLVAPRFALAPCEGASPKREEESRAKWAASELEAPGRAVEVAVGDSLAHMEGGDRGVDGGGWIKWGGGG